MLTNQATTAGPWKTIYYTITLWGIKKTQILCSLNKCRQWFLYYLILGASDYANVHSNANLGKYFIIKKIGMTKLLLILIKMQKLILSQLA